MFCPTCGREGSNERKFCPSCGTNLERVSKVISPRAESWLTRVDRGLDKFIARYAGQFFKQASAKALDRRLGHSWQIFGQGALTFLANLLLLPVMFSIIPIRLLMLLLATPVRLFTERGKQEKYSTAEKEGRKRAELQAPVPGRWLTDSVFRVTEQTTEHLIRSRAAQRKALPKTNPME